MFGLPFGFVQQHDLRDESARPRTFDGKLGIRLNLDRITEPEPPGINAVAVFIAARRFHHAAADFGGKFPAVKPETVDIFRHPIVITAEHRIALVAGTVRGFDVDQQPVTPGRSAEPELFRPLPERNVPHRLRTSAERQRNRETVHLRASRRPHAVRLPRSRGAEAVEIQCAAGRVLLTFAADHEPRHAVRSLIGGAVDDRIPSRFKPDQVIGLSAILFPVDFERKPHLRHRCAAVGGDLKRNTVGVPLLHRELRRRQNEPAARFEGEHPQITVSLGGFDRRRALSERPAATIDVTDRGPRITLFRPGAPTVDLLHALRIQLRVRFMFPFKSGVRQESGDRNLRRPGDAGKHGQQHNPNRSSHRTPPHFSPYI